ncbi:hypothetical protein TRFO_14852 [Tritrichomonas foetus]|uniref:Thioredoxin domain-containing protein n=1 Tax=Tritrichomonas foetus TaxID=1144522 RepID=A0A1J4KUX9_9EUKA|nr:hypothetical protein TRFO_14852 [Tritrichomonas foetus]|eukprot:OHT14680.1 hypothetical protein TRFO_14852 [Tritrichomonas foetus]
MKQFPYLFLQACLTSVYLLFRFHFISESDLTTLQDYEFKSFGVFGVILLIRLIRVESWLGYIVFALKITHFLMCGLMFQFDYLWGICFGIATIVVHFGVEPPFFEITQRVATLSEELLRPYIERVPECFILFYTTWENRCIAITPVFLDISEKYTTQDRLFARFDIGRSPAVEKDFQISATNGTLRQIPTIVHYKDGKEVRRYNPAIAEDKIMNYPNIIKYFKLGAPPKQKKQKKE